METSASSTRGSEPRDKEAIAVVKALAEQQKGSNMTDLREARGSIEDPNGPFTPGPLRCTTEVCGPSEMQSVGLPAVARAGGLMRPVSSEQRTFNP